MIIEYKVPRVDPGTGEYDQVLAYGCPVDVFLFGRTQRAIYQFPGGGQVCAVVHLASGQVLAYVTDEHQGHPQTKAQTALNERLVGYQQDAVERAFAQAEVLNTYGRQVGVLRFR